MLLAHAVCRHVATRRQGLPGGLVVVQGFHVDDRCLAVVGQQPSVWRYVLYRTGTVYVLRTEYVHVLDLVPLHDSTTIHSIRIGSMYTVCTGQYWYICY